MSKSKNERESENSNGGGVPLDEVEAEHVLAQSELVGRARGATVGNRKKSSPSETLVGFVRAYSF